MLKQKEDFSFQAGRVVVIRQGTVLAPPHLGSTTNCKQLLYCVQVECQTLRVVSLEVELVLAACLVRGDLCYYAARL